MGLRATLYQITKEQYRETGQGKSYVDGIDESVTPLSLGRSWGCISYLITQDENASFLNTGRQCEDVCEHCEAHSPEAISELATYLDECESSAIMQRYDSHTLRHLGIYKSDYPKMDISNYLVQFTDFVRSAKNLGNGILVVIC
ncbi:DUF1877 family protein [Microbulbifer sp. ANSA002]|uniref:DUF1877 family protein n=1 Tax=unclassified Microbulbifer TaxID=2619833 RepID=UPI00404329B4